MDTASVDLSDAVQQNKDPLPPGIHICQGECKEHDILEDQKAPRSHPVVVPAVRPAIAGCMMLRNESLRIHVTLKSLKGYVCSLIVFDTGSTDNTIELLQQWCDENNIPLYLKQGTFENFATSRNVLLDFADEVHKMGHTYDFLLLLDCNDELQNGPGLMKECERFMQMPEKIFMFRQRWLTGTFLNKYLNARLVKACHGWRYKKRVHEFLAPPPGETLLNRPNISEDVVLYQNRNDDDDKTKKRFVRDKAFLLEDVKEGDPRDMFYLAQTLSCLDEYEESYDWYQKRGDTVEGFWEERFHSYLRSGEIALGRRQDTDSAIINLFKAAMIDCRAEPLIALAKIYRSKQDFLTAYMFASIACKLNFPHGNILFVSERDYNYERWQQLSVIAFYVGRYKEGLKALDIAEKSGLEPDVHVKNRAIYQDSKDKKETEQFPFEEAPQDIKELSAEFIVTAQKALADKDPDTAIIKLLQAFEMTRQVSPLLMLSEYCRLVKANNLAYWLADFACQLQAPEFPEKTRNKETVRMKKEYNYIRYHMVGILGFHTGHLKEGKAACMRAIREGQNIPLDRRNLAFYIDAEKKNPELFTVEKVVTSEASEAPLVMTKAVEPAAPQKKTEVRSMGEYIKDRVVELQAVNPKLNIRQAEAKARLEWKLKQKGN